MRSTVRLTGQGYGAMIVGAAIGVLGLRLGYASVAGFGFALLGFVLCAVGTLRKLPPLELRREASPTDPERLAECTVTLKVRSRGTRAVRLDGVELMGGTELDVSVPFLPPGKVVHIRYPVPTTRRGRVALGPLRLRRLGLAGLANGESSLPAKHAVTVMPRVLPAAGPSGSLAVLVDDRVGSYPPDTLHFDEAVDVAASLAAAAAAAGTPFVVRTMSLPSLAGSTGGAADGAHAAATAIGGLATLALTTPPRALPRLTERDIAVGVTGPAGDPSPLVTALSTASTAVLLVVDPRPEQMVTVAGNVLVLRAPRAEELLIAWAEVTPGPRTDPVPASRMGAA